MAEMIIHLEIDQKTQKKNIYIKYISDEDALPMEHEEAPGARRPTHRRWSTERSRSRRDSRRATRKAPVPLPETTEENLGDELEQEAGDVVFPKHERSEDSLMTALIPTEVQARAVVVFTG